MVGFFDAIRKLLAWPCRPLPPVGGPYQVETAAAAVAGIVAGQAAVAGIVAGAAAVAGIVAGEAV